MGNMCIKPNQHAMDKMDRYVTRRSSTYSARASESASWRKSANSGKKRKIHHFCKCAGDYKEIDCIGGVLGQGRPQCGYLQGSVRC